MKESDCIALKKYALKVQLMYKMFKDTKEWIWMYEFYFISAFVGLLKKKITRLINSRNM